VGHARAAPLAPHTMVVREHEPIPMTASPGRRDVQRNSAYFLGAAGTAFGVLGGMFSALGILAWLDPAFGHTAPGWFFTLVVIVMLVLSVGGWPALDILTNRRPRAGGAVMAVLGVLLIGLGLVAALRTPWGVAGWFAVVGGALLLPAGYLALAGGGTEPLTWRSLRTPRVRATEARLAPVVRAVLGLSGVIGLGVLVLAAIDGRDWLTLGILGGVGLFGLGWLALAHRRRR
jgi:hypothetical protein